VPADGHLFDGSAPTLVATTDRASRERVRHWEAAGAEVLVLDHDVAGGVDVTALLGALGKRDVQGVVVEGGPTLAWSFVRDGAADRVVAYLAPRLVGGAGAPSALMGGGSATIGDALRLDVRSVRQVGDDIRVEADVHRDR
jgi:diaminohydroxyphosphoribosylaminopyrimidine deaminase/5-amino-6-(5-phosphoribosylamino)uracil reductase